MRAASATAQQSTSEVIAALGGILRALLAALFGPAAGLRNRHDHRALHGCIITPPAPEDSVACEEWIAVPAPWRAGIWPVPPRIRAHRAPAPCDAPRRAEHVRAPPAPIRTSCRLKSWIANGDQRGFDTRVKK